MVQHTGESYMYRDRNDHLNSETSECNECSCW
jgi:hypothetical protein